MPDGSEIHRFVARKASRVMRRDLWLQPVEEKKNTERRQARLAGMRGSLHRQQQTNIIRQSASFSDSHHGIRVIR